MSIQTNKAKSDKELTEGKFASELLSYPVALSQFLSLTLESCNENPSTYGASAVAQYALINWNHYLGSNEKGYREAFLKQALWLVENEVIIDECTGGWPVSFRLSSLTQGIAISVLLRAYRLTQQEAFFEVACRAVHVFERDILDGGVSTPVGSSGIFFE